MYLEKTYKLATVKINNYIPLFVKLKKGVLVGSFKSSRPTIDWKIYVFLELCDFVLPRLSKVIKILNNTSRLKTHA